MTDTLTPLLDQRHADETDPMDQFTAEEWNALDAAAVHVYRKNQARLPAHWQAPGVNLRQISDGRWHRDPAGVLRAWIYDYADTHPDDIHGRAHVPAFITKHCAERLQQFLNRDIAKRRELPYGTQRQIAQAEKAADRTRATPPAEDPEADVRLDALDRYGSIPAHEWQFMVTGYSFATDSILYETPERMAALHTRKPTVLEWWTECVNDETRDDYRRRLAHAFETGIGNAENL